MHNDNVTKTTLAGGAIAAIVASACCLGPLILVSLGIGGAWISNLTLLEPFRPVFVGSALVCMALANKKIYRGPGPEECVPGSLCSVPKTNQVYRTMFWMVSILVLIALTYPYFVTFLA
jgi:mercuric ion transport protein